MITLLFRASEFSWERLRYVWALRRPTPPFLLISFALLDLLLAQMRLWMIWVVIHASFAQNGLGPISGKES